MNWMSIRCQMPMWTRIIAAGNASRATRDTSTKPKANCVHSVAAPSSTNNRSGACKRENNIPSSLYGNFRSGRSRWARMLSAPTQPRPVPYSLLNAAIR